METQQKEKEKKNKKMQHQDPAVSLQPLPRSSHTFGGQALRRPSITQDCSAPMKRQQKAGTTETNESRKMIIPKLNLRLFTFLFSRAF